MVILLIEISTDQLQDASVSNPPDPLPPAGDIQRPPAGRSPPGGEEEEQPRGGEGQEEGKVRSEQDQRPHLNLVTAVSSGTISGRR